MTVNRYSIPSGGWVVPFGFNGAPIKAYSYDDLVVQVRKDRQARGVPVGKIDEDISAYFCGRNPHDCGGNVMVPPGGFAVPLLDRVTDWASLFDMGNPPALVDAVTAQMRAEIGCIRCPANNPLGCCGQKQPQGTLAVQLAAIRQNRDVQRYGSELFSCSHFGWNNRESVWLDRPAISDSIERTGMTREQFLAASRVCWVPDAIGQASEDESNELYHFVTTHDNPEEI